MVQHGLEFGRIEIEEITGVLIIYNIQRFIIASPCTNVLRGGGGGGVLWFSRRYAASAAAVFVDTLLRGGGGGTISIVQNNFFLNDAKFIILKNSR